MAQSTTGIGTKIVSDTLTSTDVNTIVSTIDDNSADAESRIAANEADKIEFTGNAVVVPKSSDGGIKVDTTTPTYGWRDITGDVKLITGGGGTDPTLAAYIGNIYQLQFDTLNTDEVFMEFHIPHDYTIGTDLYIHTHWSHNSASVTSGSVTWTAESTYAKGHNTDAFSATKLVTLTEAASTTQYQHMVTESQLSTSGGSATLLDTDDIEPDGMILVRINLTANSMNGGIDPFLHTVDLHYQSTNIGTKNNSPDFYT